MRPATLCKNGMMRLVPFTTGTSEALEQLPAESEGVHASTVASGGLALAIFRVSELCFTPGKHTLNISDRIWRDASIVALASSMFTLGSGQSALISSGCASDCLRLKCT